MKWWIFICGRPCKCYNHFVVIFNTRSPMHYTLYDLTGRMHKCVTLQIKLIVLPTHYTDIIYHIYSSTCAIHLHRKSYELNYFKPSLINWYPKPLKPVTSCLPQCQSHQRLKVVQNSYWLKSFELRLKNWFAETLQIWRNGQSSKKHTIWQYDYETWSVSNLWHWVLEG